MKDNDPDSPVFRIRVQKWIVYVMLVAIVLAIGVIVILTVFPREQGPQEFVLASSPLMGRQAPEFTLETLDGNTVTLTALRDHPVLINFWASWCIPCREETPDLVRAYQAHQAEGLVLLGVNLTLQDSMSDVRAFVTEFQMTYPVLLDKDGKVATLYRVQGIPTSIFINRQGVITHVQIGKLSAEQIEQFLAQILPDS